MKKIKEIFNPNTKNYWDKSYSKKIETREIRSDGDHLQKFMPLFKKAGSIMDFGSGMGGNIQYLSTKLEITHFILLDHSEISQNFVRDELLGTKDDRGNTFEYTLDLQDIPNESVDLVMSIEVLEHITEYQEIMDRLWNKVKPGGIMLISVPVKGIRDRNREHVNKFTVSSMFRIMSGFGETVHISPRTYSKRSGRLSTAYFYVEKA
ncbi:MAG: methyltransferase domain-containing protein [Bacteroidales bacterium]|nr:methyltransferase domain-containing protein [Bacteroidales bacterium]